MAQSDASNASSGKALTDWQKFIQEHKGQGKGLKVLAEEYRLKNNLPPKKSKSKKADGRSQVALATGEHESSSSVSEATEPTAAQVAAEPASSGATQPAAAVSVERKLERLEEQVEELTKRFAAHSVGKKVKDPNRKPRELSAYNLFIREHSKDADVVELLPKERMRALAAKYQASKATREPAA